MLVFPCHNSVRGPYGVRKTAALRMSPTHHTGPVRIRDKSFSVDHSRIIKESNKEDRQGQQDKVNQGHITFHQTHRKK